MASVSTSLGLGIAIAAAAAFPLAAATLRPGSQFAQIAIRQSIIVRVPVQQDAPPIKWVEKGSDKCVNVDDIAGAIVNSPDALDLILRGGERRRLKFREECQALSFYRGFYLRPGADRKLCAKRDVIHPRSGGECEIQSFKKLKPEIDD